MRGKLPSRIANAAANRRGGESNSRNQPQSGVARNAIRATSAQTASPAGISYSALNRCGAINPTSRPPTAPPAEIIRKNCVRYFGWGFSRTSSPWHTMQHVNSPSEKSAIRMKTAGM